MQQVTDGQRNNMGHVGLSGLVLVACIVWLMIISGALYADGFTEVTPASGIAHTHIFNTTLKPIEPRWITSGAAVEDYDNDGDFDVYFIGGELGRNRLYANQADGTFIDVTETAGVAVEGVQGAGPLFVDLDGDTDLDLLVFSVQGAPETFGQPAVEIPEALPKVFINNGNGTFTESSSWGLTSFAPSYSASLADIDGDEDLDMFVSRWNYTPGEMLWLNDSGERFTDISESAFGDHLENLVFTFTPIFSDLNHDGYPDLLLASDFGNSQILFNTGEREFLLADSPSISDENGMGAAIGDYDNDGDMDWFVSSIWDPDGVPNGNWGITGNRLYANSGNGQFSDVTEASGTRYGFWGWGACFADFNSDGFLDIFHENGFPYIAAVEFNHDPARLYMSNGDGSFNEVASDFGIELTGQGRGVSCFDYDNDGDLDILSSTNGESPRLFRNDIETANHYAQVRLRWRSPNTYGVGSRIIVTTADVTQLREIQAGGQFMSQKPMLAHFGLAEHSTINELSVEWPDNCTVTRQGLNVDTRHELGAHCALSMDNAVPDASVATVALALFDDEHLPVSDLEVTLELVSGPGKGTSFTVSTNEQGSAVFEVTGYYTTGETGLAFTSALSEQQLIYKMSAVLEWEEDHMITEGFESTQ